MSCNLCTILTAPARSIDRIFYAYPKLRARRSEYTGSTVVPSMHDSEIWWRERKEKRVKGLRDEEIESTVKRRAASTRACLRPIWNPNRISKRFKSRTIEDALRRIYSKRLFFFAFRIHLPRERNLEISEIRRHRLHRIWIIESSLYRVVCLLLVR